MTTKARNAAFLSAFDTYEKAIEIYYGQNNSYPASVDASGNSTASPSSAAYACLGSGYTQTTDFATNQCYLASGTVSGVVNSTVNNAFASVITSGPSMYSGTTYNSSGTVVRGLLYYGQNTSSTSTAQLVYFIQNDQPCGRGFKSSVSLGSGVTATECIIIFQNGAPTTGG